MEATAQMNVRIDPQLKAEGDRILAEHGLTPSRVIRSLYRSLTSGGERAEKAIEAIVEPDPHEQGRRAEAERKLRGVREVQSMIAAFRNEAGITDRTVPLLDDKTLLEEAIVSRYRDKEPTA